LIVFHAKPADTPPSLAGGYIMRRIQIYFAFKYSCGGIRCKLIPDNWILSEYSTCERGYQKNKIEHPVETFTHGTGFLLESGHFAPLCTAPGETVHHHVVCDQRIQAATAASLAFFHDTDAISKTLA